MKFGFVTCVELGLSCMKAIYDVGGKLDLAITLEDGQAIKKSGRVYLDDFCHANNIPLLKSRHINNQEVSEAIKALDIDWLFIIGWSQIAGKNLLESPSKGVIGMHPTLLPEGRGRAAIPWAILKGLEKTGVSMFKMDEGVDTGLIIDQFEINLTSETTADVLYKKVDIAHVLLMKKAFPKLNNSELNLIVQDESKASIWPGRTPEDGEIHLAGSLDEAEKLVRAVTRPYPGAYYNTSEGKIIVWKAKKVCESDLIGTEFILKFKDGILVVSDWEIESAQ